MNLTRNIIDGRIAVYRLSVSPYTYLSESRKVALWQRWREWAIEVGHDFAIHRVQREADGTHIPEVYVAVALGEQEDRLRALRQRFRREPLDEVEEHVHQRIGSLLKARRATSDELHWLAHRPPLRGLAEPLSDPHWTAVDGAELTGEVGHDTVPIRRAGASVVIESEHGESWQAVLYMGALPKTIEFPGRAELLSSPLETLPFAVDAICAVQWHSNQDARRQAGRQILDVDQRAADADETRTGASLTEQESTLVARELAHRLDDHDHPSLLHLQVMLVVSAPDRRELDRRVEATRRAYGSIALHRPAAYQLSGYRDTLLGLGAVGPYKRRELPDYLAAFMPCAATGVGSLRGPRIGSTATGARRPVRLDLSEAPRRNRPASVGLVGTLGSGKTMLQQLLVIEAVRQGGVAVDISPKGGRDHRLEDVLGDQVDVLDLADGFDGMLDPFLVALPELQVELAHSFLLSLLPLETRYSTAIRKAVLKVADERDPRLLRVLDHLDGEVEHELEVWADRGLATLAFGDGTARLQSARRPVTCIRAHTLQLPYGEPRLQIERTSVAVLSLLAAFALRVVADDPRKLKVVSVDEAWNLLRSGPGRDLLERVSRLGRGQQAALILSTQRTADLGEAAGLLGSLVLLGCETEAEARDGLALLGLEATDELIQTVCTNREGRGFLRDVDGRVELIQVEPGADVLAALSTTPVTA